MQRRRTVPSGSTLGSNTKPTGKAWHCLPTLHRGTTTTIICWRVLPTTSAVENPSRRTIAKTTRKIPCSTLHKACHQPKQEAMFLPLPLHRPLPPHRIIPTRGRGQVVEMIVSRFAIIKSLFPRLLSRLIPLAQVGGEPLLSMRLCRIVRVCTRLLKPRLSRLMRRHFGLKMTVVSFAHF